MIDSKYMWVLLIFAGIGLFLFYDMTLTSLLGLLGLGGANELAKKANKAKSEADAHEEMADAYLNESVNEINEARESHQEALDIADDTTEPNYELPPGFKPRNSSSR